MIEDILKNNKIKVTKPRILILSYITKNKQVTLKDIINNLQKIDQSTIYRTLTLLEEKMIIIKIFNNHETYFKLNNNNHKHYIECINCHFKQEINECPYNNINLNGFIIKKDETIKGICQNCQNSNKIGIFVGSFNPPTKAHLEIGKMVLKKNIVSEIIYIPCDNLIKKDLIDIKERYNLLKEMIKNKQNMIIDDLKLKNRHRNFTYKDIYKIKDKYLKELYIIIGSDLLDNLYNWKNYQDLLKNFNFIVINRLNSSDLDIIKNKYSKYNDKFIIINYNNNISSTKVREKIKNNEKLDDFLENNVIEYIKNNNLYQ